MLSLFISGLPFILSVRGFYVSSLPFYKLCILRLVAQSTVGSTALSTVAQITDAFHAFATSCALQCKYTVRYCGKANGKRQPKLAALYVRGQSTRGRRKFHCAHYLDMLIAYTTHPPHTHSNCAHSQLSILFLCRSTPSDARDDDRQIEHSIAELTSVS
jgi:hypothetical protein